MSENQIESKSFDFAVRIVNLYKFLAEQKKEFVLSKQLLRSGRASAQTLQRRKEVKARRISLPK